MAERETSISRPWPRVRSGAWFIASAFAVAALAVICGVAVRFGLFNELMNRTPYVTLFPAVTVAAVLRGLPAGIIATFLSAVAVAIWIAPIREASDEIGLAAFLLSCTMIVGVTEAMHRANARAARAEARSRVSDAIRENEARMRVLIDQASDGIFFADESGRLRDVNQEACALLGLQRAELLASSLSDHVVPEEQENFRSTMASHGDQNAYIGEWRFTRSHSDPFVGEISARRLSTGGLQAFLRDVSERRRADAALKESQAQLSAVVNTAVDAIIVIDSRGEIRSVNPAALRMFGYQEAELVGENVSMLMEGAHRASHDQYMGAYLRTGMARIIGTGREIEARRKDGSIFPIDLTITETKLDEHVFIGFIRDISKLKKALDAQIALTERLYQSQQEARKEHARFQGVFDSAPEPIILTTLDRRITVTNPAFDRLFGFQPGELRDSDISAITSNMVPDWPNGIEEPARISSATLSQPQPMTFQRKDQSTFPGEILIAPYLDEDLLAIGAVAIVRDLTAKFELEDARRNSQKLEALGQLTGGIAHDFNNILTTLIGNLEILAPQVEAEEGRTALRRAGSAAEMASRLTRRMLTFAQRRKLDPVPANLNEQISNIADLLRRALGDSISLEIELDPSLWPARVDLSEFENAVINLALNARDAMPNGGRITVRTRNVAAGPEIEECDFKSSDYVVIEVEDTGLGMTPDIERRAFEPFFSTKGSGRGTGLGLSTVHGFTEQSGGRALLQTEPGRGTSVRLFLPRSEKPPAPLGMSELPVMSENAETVLVVEDDNDVRESVLQRVEGLGYVAIEAASGSEAMLLLKTSTHVDLVFSDVSMPNMSGYDLAVWIFEHRPDVRVVLTSGHVGSAERPAALGDRSIDVLLKPYDRLALATALSRALH